LFRNVTAIPVLTIGDSEKGTIASRNNLIRNNLNKLVSGGGSVRSEKDRGKKLPFFVFYIRLIWECAAWNRKGVAELDDNGGFTKVSHSFFIGYTVQILTNGHRHVH